MHSRNGQVEAISFGGWMWGEKERRDGLLTLDFWLRPCVYYETLH